MQYINVWDMRNIGFRWWPEKEDSRYGDSRYGDPTLKKKWIKSPNSAITYGNGMRGEPLLNEESKNFAILD